MVAWWWGTVKREGQSKRAAKPPGLLATKDRVEIAWDLRLGRRAPG